MQTSKGNPDTYVDKAEEAKEKNTKIGKADESDVLSPK